MGRSFAELVRGGRPEVGWSSRPFFSEAWRHLRELIEEYVDTTTELKGRFSGSRVRDVGPLDREREARLRALGYIQ